MSALNRIIAIILTFIGIVAFIVLFILGLLLFSYILLIGAVIALILFAIGYIRAKLSKKKVSTFDLSNTPTGRIIEQNETETEDNETK